MSLLGEVVGWVLFGLFLLIPGAFAAALWAPFLAVERIRRLVVALPPRGRLVPTYVGLAIAGSVPYLFGLGWILTTLPSEGAAWSNAILTLIQYAAVLYVLLVPTLVVLGLPRLEIGWDPANRFTTWLWLVVGGFWYALTFSVPLFVLALVWVWPGGY